MGILSVITIILLIAKLLGYTIKWYVVFLPLTIEVVATLLIATVAVLAERKKSRWR